MPLKENATAEFTATHKPHFQKIFTAPQPTQPIPVQPKKDCFGGLPGASFLKEYPSFLEMLLLRAPFMDITSATKVTREACALFQATPSFSLMSPWIA
jgi:hypothetical protein